MLMKAAQPCKQHGRMSLEYITIHNCLPRAGGVRMAQPWSTSLHTHTHTHTSMHSHTLTQLSQPTWRPRRPELPKNNIAEMMSGHTTELFVQKSSQIWGSALEQQELILQIHNTLSNMSMILFWLPFLSEFSSSPAAKHSAHMPRKAENWYKLLGTEIANWGSCSDCRHFEGNRRRMRQRYSQQKREKERKRERDRERERERAQTGMWLVFRSVSCSVHVQERERDRERDGGGEQVKQATVCGRVCCLFLFSQRQSKHSGERCLPGFVGLQCHCVRAPVIWQL